MNNVATPVRKNPNVVARHNVYLMGLAAGCTAEDREPEHFAMTASEKVDILTDLKPTDMKHDFCIAPSCRTPCDTVRIDPNFGHAVL
jgi:hypothetical protein